MANALTDSEKEQARAMGVSERQIRKAESDMAQAERDYQGDEEDERLAYVDALKDCNRCPLRVDELLALSLSELKELYRQYV